MLTIYALVHTAFIRTSYREKKQCVTFLLISVLPVIALVVYVAKLTYVYDLSALVLGLALSMVVILVWSRRYYESHARRIIDRNGILQGYALLVLDMTDTHNYIDQIAQMRTQAEEANVAKSAFLANMSHEIRTPMNAIVGLSEIIMEESRGTAIYSNARDVRSSAQNLLELINYILDLSKVEAGKMELVLTDYDIRFPAVITAIRAG